MSEDEKVVYVLSQSNTVFIKDKYTDMSLHRYCTKDGIPLEELQATTESEVKKVKEVEATVVDPTLEDLKKQAKSLGIRGYNNAKKDTLIKKIAEAGEEDGEEEGS